MESEFEKNLQKVQPKGITPEEKNMLWSNIGESIKAEEYIKAHKSVGAGFFNLFTGIKRLRYIVAAILTGTLISGSFATAALADNSRPGDLLFPLDLAVENIQLRLAADDGRDELRIQFASERLDEVKELLALANINYEVFEAATMAMDDATSTASTTDDTATTTDDTATTTDDTSDDADSATTTDSSDSSNDEEDDDDSDSSGDSSNDDEEDDDSDTPEVSNSALTKASNAFLVALEYLQNSRAALVADGNTNATLVMDAFIAELTVLADGHVDDIKKSRIVVNSGPNDSSKVKIAIKAKIDDVETKFNFQETTRSSGGTEARVTLESGDSSIKLNVVDAAFVEAEEDKWDREIDVCYKGESKDVSYDDIGHYMKKGASLGNCDDDDDDYDGNGKKRYVCHNGKTLHIAYQAKQAHLNHGDYPGKCEDDDDDDDDEKYYICYRGETKKVDLEDKYEYLDRGATNGKCSSGEVVQIPSCPLDDDVDDRTIYTFGAQVLRSDQNESNSYTTHKDVDLDEGLYKVTLVSYDGYVGRENKMQPNESWHITLWDESENAFQKTNDVSDIPDYVRQETVVEVVNDSFEYDGNADELYAEHAVYPDKTSANSVKVICAAFDKLQDDRDITAPSITNVSSAPSQTSVSISWNTDESATSKVWYGTTDSASPANLGDFVYSGSLKTNHLLTINSLTPDTTYYYFVESEDAEGNTAISERKTFDTDAEPDTSAPSFTGIAVNASTTEVSASWTTDEPTTGTFYFSTSPSVDSSADSVTSVVLGTSHGINEDGLSDDTTYYYIIVIEDASGNTSTSTESSFTTVEIPEVDITAPEVSGLSVEATTTSATISFNTDEEAISNLWFSPTSPVSVSSPMYVFPLEGLSTSHSFTLESLTPETEYFFVIEVFDGSGNSKFIDEDSFTTTAVPTPPDTEGPVLSSVATVIGSTTATLSFTTNEDATSVIYYADSPTVDTGSASSLSIDSLTSTHEFNLTGLSASTTYYYVLEATDEALNTTTASEDSVVIP